MITVSRLFAWDAAHRVYRHESKCGTVHGHRYTAQVTVSAPLDALTRVIDFGGLREVVGGWIDTWWDHTTLVNREDKALLAFLQADCLRSDRPIRAPYVFNTEPTAEAIAMELFRVIVAELLPEHVTLVSVTVWETPNCSATVTA